MIKKIILNLLLKFKKTEKLNHNYLYNSDLKNLNEISIFNIYFYNLVEKFQEKFYINAEFINQEQYKQLSKGYSKNNNKNYHQINIYILKF